MPTTAGRRDDRQPEQSGPAPKYLHHHGLEKAHNHNIRPADLPASVESMHRPGPASRPFVLATLRALRLDPGPLPDAAYTQAESQHNPRSPTFLTEPRPFRDDSVRPLIGNAFVDPESSGETVVEAVNRRGRQARVRVACTSFRSSDGTVGGALLLMEVVD
jgi:hypothetical protein